MDISRNIYKFWLVPYYNSNYRYYNYNMHDCHANANAIANVQSKYAYVVKASAKRILSCNPMRRASANAAVSSGPARPRANSNSRSGLRSDDWRWERRDAMRCVRVCLEAQAAVAALRGTRHSRSDSEPHDRQLQPHDLEIAMRLLSARLTSVVSWGACAT